MGTGQCFKVYQASAGSGKTFTIVKEYLELCLKSQEHVGNFRRILAITFTNASANDMKVKVLNHINGIINSPVGHPTDMEQMLLEDLGISDDELKTNAKLLLTSILHDYSSFCISTIDAFVQKLSRTFAIDLGLPSQYSVSVDTDEMAETISNNLGLQMGDDNPFLTKIMTDFSENQFSHEKFATVQNMLTDYVKRLMTEKAYQRDENNMISDAAQYKETLDFMNKKTDSFETRIKDYVARIKAIEKKYSILEEDHAQGSKGFPSFLKNLMKGEVRISRNASNVMNTRKWYSTKAEKHFSKDMLEQVGQELFAVYDALMKDMEDSSAEYLFYKTQKDALFLYALRSAINEEFLRVVQDEEVVHISEFNKLLNTVMGDFSVPFVYERIGERFNHVFVDEFQDTSTMQWQNLLPLVDNGLANNAMSMVVGDGKQAIYRFRSGEVGQIVKLPEIYALPTDDREQAFQQYEKNLINHFSFNQLDTNYRSFQELVRFNSEFFEKAKDYLPEQWKSVYVGEDVATGKHVSVAQRSHQSQQGLVQVELYDKEALPDYTLQRIEELVRELTEHNGYNWGDIKILVRKSRTGAIIANYLNEKGIPVTSDESILLKSSDKVQLVVNTLYYLVHPENEVYVANVLYYYRLVKGGIADGQLDQVFAQVKRVANGEVAIETAMGIGEPGVLTQLLSKATCLYDFCMTLVRMYGIETLYDAYMDYFLEEVYKFQSGPTESITDFLSIWERKQKDLSVQSVSSDAVGIMTIHKSKGLEFKVVIYPDAIIDLDEHTQGKSEEMWLGPEELGFDDIPNLTKVLFKLDSNAEECMGEKASDYFKSEKGKNRLDNLNLLYVAFTRAIQRLYVLAPKGKIAKDGERQENVIMDFLADKETHLIEEKGSELAIYRFGDPCFVDPDKKEGMRKEPKSEVVSGNWMEKIQLDPEPSMFWMNDHDKMQPVEWGTLVHKILSKVGTREDVDKAMEPYLLDGSLNHEMADMLKSLADQMVSIPTIANAFDCRAKVKNECEILIDHEIIRPDRYAELPDVIYLIDYKTGKKEEKHHRQLKNYISALQRLVTKEIRAYLVYLSDSIEVEEVVLDTLF